MSNIKIDRLGEVREDVKKILEREIKKRRDFLDNPSFGRRAPWEYRERRISKAEKDLELAKSMLSVLDEGEYGRRGPITTFNCEFNDKKFHLKFNSLTSDLTYEDGDYETTRSIDDDLELKRVGVPQLTSEQGKILRDFMDKFPSRKEFNERCYDLETEMKQIKGPSYRVVGHENKQPDVSEKRWKPTRNGRNYEMRREATTAEERRDELFSEKLGVKGLRDLIYGGIADWGIIPRIKQGEGYFSKQDNLVVFVPPIKNLQYGGIRFNEETGECEIYSGSSYKDPEIDTKLVGILEGNGDVEPYWKGNVEEVLE